MEWGFHVSPRCIISLWMLFLRYYDIAGLNAGMGVNAEAFDGLKLSAVTGGDATLLCDTRPPHSTDVIQLIVWYKDDTPICSYDSRLQGSVTHWSDPKMADRLHWHPTAPSSLRIRGVLPTDRALYRCRVDFKISPTRNNKVMLDVIELPEKPKIFDEYDKEVELFAGPYVENTSMKLTCVVSGGIPMPRLRWWRDDQVVSTLPPVNDGSRLSLLELRIPELTRDYYEALYACTADNTILVPPQRVTVQIQLYLRPLFVEILTKEQPLSVDQRAELNCRAIGSRPPAVISWWLDNMQISSAQKDIDSQNETISILRWIPRMEQNGKRLTCRATHEMLAQEIIETSITLDLYYVPIAEVRLGSNMNPNDIEEGDDVYFECIIEANPPAYKVVWEHNGQQVSHNKRAGVIVGSSHLALQRVSRVQAGKYSCTASNVEGDGKSPSTDLLVVYKPTCKTNVVMVVGAAVNEATRITCEVDAFPKPKGGEWQWIVNNSAGTLEMLPDKFTIADGRSILTVTPTSEADYGTITCRASNIAGQQVEPCRYTLLPAVRPDPLFDCSTSNLTDNSAELKCTAGYNGGLHTIYFIEVWESNTLILNLSNPLPAWKLRGLGPGKALKLVFYAYNARGRSESALLKVHTLSRPAIHIDTKPLNKGLTMNWMLGVFSGVIGILVLVSVVAMITRQHYRQPVQYAAPIQMVKTYKSSIHNENHSPLPPDDKNPDVVPFPKDLNFSRGAVLPPDPPPYRAIAVPHRGISRSVHSLHRESHSGAVTSITPPSDAQNFDFLTEDWRSIKSESLRRGREIVTMRASLLANAQESCV